MFIYEHKEWPNFVWDKRVIAEVLAPVKFSQGYLLGQMQNLGFALQEEAILKTMTGNIIKSSEIEGEHLNTEEVRSSVARHLGMDIGGLLPVDRSIDGIVEMHLDATVHYNKRLTEKRLYQWHSALFPRSLSGMKLITPGHFRTDTDGPMQVVSGAYGREKVHFQAPPADQLQEHIKVFLSWFNSKPSYDPLIKASISHLWFVTLHPFEDGNGRVARAIADMALTQSEGQNKRFYSMSMQIRKERKIYYDKLEYTQKHGLDITHWITWFLNCLDRAIAGSTKMFQQVLNKAQFWEQHAGKPLNKRQIDMLNTLFDGFKGKLTTSKWAKMMKCSQDTAARDINKLVEYDILMKGAEGGRSTHYNLKGFEIKQIP